MTLLWFLFKSAFSQRILLIALSGILFNGRIQEVRGCSWDRRANSPASESNFFANSHAHGQNVVNNGINSFAQGQRIISNADNNVTFGLGGTNTWLDNSQSQSFMVGFDSDAPTLFVSSASGNGTTGNVGIGGPGYTPLTTPAPLEKLEVWNGNIAQTNVDQVATTSATTGNSSTNLLGLSPGTCPVWGLTTNNLGTTNAIPGIANSFVQVGVDGSRPVPGPMVSWSDTESLDFIPNSSIGGCNTVPSIQIMDPNVGPMTGFAFYINGDGHCNGLWTSSDVRFKEGIKKIENANELIQKLNGRNYTYSQNFKAERNFSDREQFGFIAQEIATIVPDLVMEMNDGYMAVNYIGLIPIIVEAFKIQQEEIDSLKSIKRLIDKNLEDDDLGNSFNEYLDSIVLKKVDSLSQMISVRDDKIDSISSIVSQQENEIREIKQLLNKISKCLETANLCTHSNTQEGELMDLPQLYQNNPNPFSSETKIQYYLPKNSLPAKIDFFDVNGKTVQNISLTNEGNQEIVVNSELMPSGTIYYHLNCGNKIYGPYKMAVIRN